MVQVSPRTKGMAKKIQKQCTPHHPFGKSINLPFNMKKKKKKMTDVFVFPLVFEMMDMCALKSYSETDSVANLFRKKLSSTHSSGNSFLFLFGAF